MIPLFEVFNCRLQPAWVILEKSQSGIAEVAEKSANFVGAMDVVHRETSSLRLLVADRADAALGLEHRFVLVLGQQIATEPRSLWLLPFLEPFDRVRRKFQSCAVDRCLSTLDEILPILGRHTHPENRLPAPFQASNRNVGLLSR